MLFAEAQARWLLITHAITGAATVAVTTHLLLWSRRLWRGELGRMRGVRWFASVGFGLYVVQFLLGNILYPTYKVRVRTEYFDLPSAVQADGQARRAAREQADARRAADARHDGRGVGFTGPPPTVPASLMRVSRLFDVKEHWVALGLPLAAAACALAFGWKPREDGRTGGKLLLVCALGAAACAWLAGVVGLVVASYRSVGGMS